MNENITTSGYTPCACRDCMDVTVSDDMTKPELCTECTEAGCETWNEDRWYASDCDCQRDDAYSDGLSDAGTGHGAPEQLDRAIAVSAERYRAMTPADIRRERRQNRREYRMGAVRAWFRWILHI